MRIWNAALLLVLPLLGVAPTAVALEALDDVALSAESGAGVAIGLHDFQLAMAPTSYFEQVGSAPAGGGCTGVGTIASNIKCWRRGDLRWYGINISAAGGSNDGYHWNDTTPCSSSSLDCPRGGTIAFFSPFDNPYLIRAASPAGITYSGECVNGATVGCTAPATPISKAIYEFLAPTSQPYYTFSWWGEMETGSTRNSATQTLATNAGAVLKSQNVIRGNAAGSAFRLFQFTQAGNQTFGMLYHSRLRGDYRLSVNQVDPDGAGPVTTSDAIGQPTYFSTVEGMYFRNVDAFIPIGQLYYQALTVSAVGTSGNFEIALTPIPNTALVYNKHYALNAGDSRGYETARANNTGGSNTADYDLTHGFSRWGGWSATGLYTTNAINATDDGIYFRACTGCANFLAYADSPVSIDKRSNHSSGHPVSRSYEKETIRTYECNSGNTGGCTTATPPGPTFNGTSTTTASLAGSPSPSTRTYPTNAVNLGDSRIEGLMFNSLRFESCAAGGC
ncbi:MAG: hypothetical protein K0S46_2034 [Moraxellaceae bacterium]|jgi:hypothetical protein|nr:hypothetical protein [Moraxellaceae bacterium]